MNFKFGKKENNEVAAPSADGPKMAAEIDENTAKDINFLEWSKNTDPMVVSFDGNSTSARLVQPAKA